ncbi:hypothetical protein CGZ90_06760 [Fictibacillus aquaticus]|uniref:Uncharacterized protein n=1 Tax=Fictibacillus aquaticus TaxID=2021314 RepID=A0A235FF60_9BACL|nr:hypothetical protein CGZ90_06760 [Fictibacillus aquaticus]
MFKGQLLFKEFNECKKKAAQQMLSFLIKCYVIYELSLERIMVRTSIENPIINDMASNTVMTHSLPFILSRIDCES